MTADDVLSPQDIEQFLDQGYVKLTGCFGRDAAQEYLRDVWERLGYDEHDPATWERPLTHLEPGRDIDVRTFAPTVWQAACQLVGGEDRMIPERPIPWTDAFIVNLSTGSTGSSGGAGEWEPASPASPGWHVDGSWFRHYLDSPEQGLLTIVLWSDVEHRGGATFVAIDSIAPMARFLAAHPGGVLPSSTLDPDGPVFDYAELAGECGRFIEATGEVGDVYLLHPLVLHAASRNALGRPRFITNSTLMLAEPLRFDRPDPQDHSPVERAVLRALGVDRLEFTATGPRGRLVPAR